MSKTIKTRIAQKHDIEANWLKAKNFKPLAGELIIYDAETSSNDRPRDDQDNLLRLEVIDYPRIKVGDGEHVVSELPFISDSGLVQMDPSSTLYAGEYIFEVMRGESSTSECGYYILDRDGNRLPTFGEPHILFDMGEADYLKETREIPECLYGLEFAGGDHSINIYKSCDQLLNDLSNNKVDKVTEATGFRKVYAINKTGQQSVLTVASEGADIATKRIPFYRPAGNPDEFKAENDPSATIPVTDPVWEYDASNKRYVDTTFKRIAETTAVNNPGQTGAGAVYTNATGTAKTIPVEQNNIGGSIVQRMGDGTIKASTPQASSSVYSVATKEYVDMSTGASGDSAKGYTDKQIRELTISEVYPNEDGSFPVKNGNYCVNVEYNVVDDIHSDTTYSVLEVYLHRDGTEVNECLLSITDIDSYHYSTTFELTDIDSDVAFITIQAQSNDALKNVKLTTSNSFAVTTSERLEDLEKQLEDSRRDIDTKLVEPSGTGAVYKNDVTKEIKTIAVDANDITGSTIVQRSGGIIKAKTPDASSSNNAVTTKEYVQSGLDTKVDKLYTANHLYGTDKQGAETAYTVCNDSTMDYADGKYIPAYHATGIDEISLAGESTTIPVGNPVGKYDAVNKNYVDTKISDLIGTTPETLDTLEEIAKWITEDESGTEALINRVTDLEETKISRLSANGFDTVYAVNPQGKDTFFRVTTDKAAQVNGRLPIYREAGVDYDAVHVNATIPVCDPIGAFDAVNKSYVDNEVQNLQTSKVDLTDEANKIYGTDDNGNQVTYSFDPFSDPEKTEKGFGDIPKYISSVEEAYQHHIPNKTILVGEPVVEHSAVNKNYVDNAVGSANYVERKATPNSVYAIGESGGLEQIVIPVLGQDSGKGIYEAMLSEIPRYIYAGDAPFSYDISNKTLLVGTPLNDIEAANKGYVDSEIERITVSTVTNEMIDSIISSSTVTKTFSIDMYTNDGSFIRTRSFDYLPGITWDQFVSTYDGDGRFYGTPDVMEYEDFEGLVVSSGVYGVVGEILNPNTLLSVHRNDHIDSVSYKLYMNTPII